MLAENQDKQVLEHLERSVLALKAGPELDPLAPLHSRVVPTVRTAEKSLRRSGS